MVYMGNSLGDGVVVKGVLEATGRLHDGTSGSRYHLNHHTFVYSLKVRVNIKPFTSEGTVISSLPPLIRHKQGI